MKKIIYVSLCIILLSGCSKKDSLNIDSICHCDKVENCKCKDMYQNIDLETAKKLINDGNTFLVDVRTKEEYEANHINDAINIPLDQIEDIKIAKNMNLVVYCKSGTRSKNATLKLLELGYVNVYDFGSMENWK